MWKYKYAQACMPAQSLICVQLFFDPVDCSPLGSSVHGILQARTLEWVAIYFSRWFSQPRDQAQVSCIIGGLFTIWATWEAKYVHCIHKV